MSEVATTTPYNAAKAVNVVLKDRGIIDTNPRSKRLGQIKEIPSQMMYNYTTMRINKGEKPLIACDDQGRILVSALQEWLQTYVFKLENKSEESVPVLTVD